MIPKRGWTVCAIIQLPSGSLSRAGKAISVNSLLSGEDGFHRRMKKTRLMYLSTSLFGDVVMRAWL
jgi:hypothetical protein